MPTSSASVVEHLVVPVGRETPPWLAQVEAEGAGEENRQSSSRSRYSAQQSRSQSVRQLQVVLW